MKLTIKTLQSTTFKVDIEPHDLVKDLKAKIEKEQGKDYPSASQKLIYSGKILADESKIEEYNFDEKKFVVLMITRPPPVVAAKLSEPAVEKSSSKPDEKAKSGPTSADAKPLTSTTAATTTITTTSSTPATMTPSSATQQQQPQPITGTTTTTPARPSVGATESTEASYPSMGDPNFAPRLAALMSQPHFRQMQDLIQQSPHLLSSTIEALAASDPEMYSFISQNPDAFVNALNHPPTAGSRIHSSGRGPSNPVAQHAGQIEQQVGGGGGSGRQQPVVDQILGDGVSEHDKQAIERLKELGFSEYLAVQAYMACDKDEQLAANLLFQMEQ